MPRDTVLADAADVILLEQVASRLRAWRIRACAAEDAIRDVINGAMEGADQTERLKAYSAWVCSDKFAKEMPK